MMRRTFVLVVETAVLLSVMQYASAQSPPERERGFKPDLVYQLNNIDSINLFNGNLNATLPIATYPVAADVSYSFTLRYSGNLWKDFEHCQPRIQAGEEDCHVNWRPLPDNGGLGWQMSFGRLQAANYTHGPDAAGTWQYISSDGAEHSFYDTLREPVCIMAGQSDCDHKVGGIRYTRDGTYLRLREPSDGVKIVEFPDGQRHRFTNSDGEWRLRYIYGASSAINTLTGEPATNWVKFEYPSNAVDSNIKDCRITDSHDRSHYVTFQSGYEVGIPVVDHLDLAAFRGPCDASSPDTCAAADAAARAKFNFTYDEYTVDASGTPVDGTPTSVPKPYDSVNPWVSVRLLRRVDLPSGEAWLFRYHDATAYPDPFSGTLTEATLPTLGKIRWSYHEYVAASALNSQSVNVVGVKDRSLVEVVGSAEVKRQHTRHTLDAASGSVAVETLAPGASEWIPESKVVHYFDYTYGSTYALPYTPSVFDGSTVGRNLSSATFSCPGGACNAERERAAYVKYEMDSLAGTACHVDYPCARERNRRVVAERTTFEGDGSGHADTERSLFDGLGHHRKEVVSRSDGYSRETYTAFNLTSASGAQTVGTYVVTSNGARASGYTMLPFSDPWILNTFTTSYVTTNGKTAHAEACFDRTTGFLSHRRTKLRTDGANDPRDMLTIYTRDDSTGYAKREEFFGGDVLDAAGAGLPSGALCSLTPARDARTLRIDYTTEHGVLKTKRHYDYSTNGYVPFFSVEAVDIDRNTGLVRQSKDVSGLVTTYSYDSSGRLARVQPPGTAATTYTYGNASTTAPARVNALAGSGSARVEQAWEFDPFGRLSIEKRLMPDGTWSGRKTVYDTAGRRGSVSEQEKIIGSTFTPINVTQYSNYDPFGRVGLVRSPDDRETSFAYDGDRVTTRTYGVGDTTVSVEEVRDGGGHLIQVVEDATGARLTTDYTYDVGGRLSKVTMRDGMKTQTRTFNYDGRGLLTSESHPESGLTSYTYDARANVVTRTTPMVTLDHTYDRAGRLTRVQQGSSPVKVFEYDRPNSGSDYSLGKLDTATRYNYTGEWGNVAATEKYFYANAAGRLSAKETTVTRQLPTSDLHRFSETYTYNVHGDVSGVEYPKCTAGGCTAMVAPARTITNTFRYGQVTAIAPYTVAAGISYNANGTIGSIRHRNADGLSGPRWVQTVENGMARPASISVTDFCDESNLKITQQPQSHTVTAGGGAGLIVTAGGATRYQWYRVTATGAVALTGETNPTLNATVSETATYFVRVGNANCAVDSARATVTVQACTAPDATITVASAVTASTTAHASVPVGAAGTTYAWTITNGDIVSGGGTREISFTAACSGTVTLSVEVTNGCASSSSRTIAITAPQAVVSGSQTIAEGAAATINVQLTGVGPWSLTWSDGYTQPVPASSSTASRSVSPSTTTTYSITSVTDGASCAGTPSGSAIVTIRPPQPTGVRATAVSATQVSVTWQFSGTADRFDVYRAGTFVGSSNAASYTDATASPSAAYVYTVKTVKEGTSSLASSGDLATTVMFSDDPVVAYQTVVRAVHVTQLQTAVNAVRTAAGLAPYTFTAITGVIRAAHLEELRSAVDPARSTLGLSAATYSRRPLGATMTIKADDVNETRGGVR